VAKLVQPVEDSQLKALQDHVVGALDLPVRLGVHHGCPIYADMVIITEAEELFVGELHVIVGADGVWDLKAVNDVDKEGHRLLGLYLHDWPSLDPL
jgi:hypothetical protein